MSNTDINSRASDLAIRGQGYDLTANGKISLSTADAAVRLISSDLWQAPGAPLTITYAFRSAGYAPDGESTGFQSFNAQQIEMTQKALAAWASVANINFVRVDDGNGYSNNAAILFGDFLAGSSSGFTYLPGSIDPGSVSGDVWINAGASYNLAPAIGNYGALTLIHEIGHALGLLHPSDYDDDGTYLTFYGDADHAEDTLKYSVMSYFGADHGVAAAEQDPFPFAPEVDDIAAAQQLFGANITTNAGNSVYGFNATVAEPWFAYGSTSRNINVYALWDAGGTDTFDFSKATVGLSIDLRPGGLTSYWGSQQILLPDNVVIENAIGGSGDNTIIGNSAANILRGGNFSNHLYGEGGDDTLVGGTGGDYLDGGSGTNTIDGGGGTDFLLLPGSVFDYTTTLGSDGRYTISGHGIVDVVSNIAYVDLPQKLLQFGAFVSVTTKAPGPAGYHNPALNDQDGNGSSDLLVRNADGALAVWDVAVPPATANVPLFTYIPPLITQQTSQQIALDPSLHVVATMDLNGDHRADILARGLDGTVSILVGGASGQPAYRSGPVGYDWAIAAVGDVNGDGKDDLVWESRSHAVSVWLSTGTGFLDLGAAAAPQVGAHSALAGVGDFNGDGRADLLWRNADGTIATWIGSGDGFAARAFYTGKIDPSWQFAGTADFNGDGKDDLLWKVGTNAYSIALSDGSAFRANSVAVSYFSISETHVVQLADINHDGDADIILRDASGATRAFLSAEGGSSFRFSSASADIAASAAILSPAVAAANAPSVTSDFNGDGHSDILWRNDSGAVSDWTVTGNVVSDQLHTGAYDGFAPVAWSIVESLDMNGDGLSDLLWRNANGALSVWDGAANGFQGGSYDTSVPTNWTVAAAGDFNGDGMDDILWRQDAGALSYWTSTGSGFHTGAYNNNSVPTDWKVEGAGDFNGDGKSDILWRNDAGAVSTWLATDAGFQIGSYNNAGVPTAWHVAGLADFNGDGRDDILWRNDGGALSTWLSNGTGFDMDKLNDTVPTDWKIAATGDYNNDGKADILWRNDNGAVSMWNTNGDATGFVKAIGDTHVPSDWHIVAHDFF